MRSFPQIIQQHAPHHEEHAPEPQQHIKIIKLIEHAQPAQQGWQSAPSQGQAQQGWQSSAPAPQIKIIKIINAAPQSQSSGWGPAPSSW